MSFQNSTEIFFFSLVQLREAEGRAKLSYLSLVGFPLSYGLLPGALTQEPIGLNSRCPGGCFVFMGPGLGIDFFTVNRIKTN